MLQMAEVWHKERCQMKLIDAKVILEEKYFQMNKLVTDLEAYLISRNATPDVEEMRKAEFLLQAATSVNLEEIKEFTYEPPNPDDIYSVFEEVNFGGINERVIEPCVGYSPASRAFKIHTVSPNVNVFNKGSTHRRSSVYVDHSGDEEDESEWETVSHLEDQGSSSSPEGSDPSVNKIRCDCNVSESRTEWQENECKETPITEINEVCAAPKTHLKRVSSIARLWRSCPNDGENFKIMSLDGMNGRLSNGSINSSDRGSAKGELKPVDLVGRWTSLDSGNPHIP